MTGCFFFFSPLGPRRIRALGSSTELRRSSDAFWGRCNMTKLSKINLFSSRSCHRALFFYKLCVCLLLFLFLFLSYVFTMLVSRFRIKCLIETVMVQRRVKIFAKQTFGKKYMHDTILSYNITFFYSLRRRNSSVVESLEQ